MSPNDLPTAAPNELSSTRLFLALWPTPALDAPLGDYRRQCRWPKNALPVKADRLHLTLHFIGAVEHERLGEVAAGLHVEVEPFELSLRRAAIWPNGVAVLQADETPDALRRLHEQLGDALRALDLPVEKRPFRPHLTLARHALGATLPGTAPQLRWPVTDYRLVASTLGAGGGYRLVKRYA